MSKTFYADKKATRTKWHSMVRTPYKHIVKNWVEIQGSAIIAMSSPRTPYIIVHVYIYIEREYENTQSPIVTIKAFTFKRGGLKKRTQKPSNSRL